LGKPTLSFCLRKYIFQISPATTKQAGRRDTKNRIRDGNNGMCLHRTFVERSPSAGKKDLLNKGAGFTF